MTKRRVRVLVISRNYPNPVLPHLGLWVERPTRELGRHVDLQVVSPIPWCPPLPAVGGLRDRTRFRRIPALEVRHGLHVHHPRFLAGPGYRFHEREAQAYYWGVRSTVARLRRHFPFDLIHAHFTYPDGVAAQRLGRLYDVPVVVTEHAPWQPWMDEYPGVKTQAVKAARLLAAHLPVSRAVADTIAACTIDRARLQVVPVGVDGDVFTPNVASQRDAAKICYVGMPRAGAKGVDVLLAAMRRVVARHDRAHLVVVGGPFFGSQRGHFEQLQREGSERPLAGRVTFAGEVSPAEVARHMASSAVLALPSRLESFGAVLVEALACGTPVVSTRCGGPLDIVTPEVGRLVAVDDPAALADGLLDVLAQPPGTYPVERLRTYALERFSWSVIARKVLDVYDDVLAQS